MTKTFILNTDGGSRGNPGPAAIGGTLKSDSGDLVADYKEKIGIATNNTAEYKALIKGLQVALENNVENLKCVLDSELVVKQLNGQYRVKEDSLKILHAEIKNLATKFDTVQFTHVKRHENSAADKLVNEALDNK